MKKITLILVATLAATLTLGSLALACEITISSDRESGSVGDNVSLTITVKQTHRKCALPIEETKISIAGMRIVSHTPWKQVSTGTNQITLSAELTAAGEAALTVIRECDKEGYHEQVKRISVKS